MIIAHRELSAPIPLSETQPTVLILENEQLFRQWIQMLSQQCEGDQGAFCLSHEGEDRHFAKHALIIRDPLFDTEVESRISNTLLRTLEKLARNDYVAETQRVEEILLSYADQLITGLNISLESSESIDIKALMKLLHITPRWEEDLCARLSSQMRLAQEFLHTELYILVGCKSYLTSSELGELYQEFARRQAKLLLIESHQREILAEENTIIIDRDLCELRFDAS